jgi:YbbR domain-containing protein
LKRVGGQINMSILVMSLFLSVMLWLIVYSQTVPAQTPQTFWPKVRAEGLNEDELFVRSMQETIPITLQGPEARMRQVREAAEAPFAVVDLSGARPGRLYYPVQIYPEFVRPLLVNPDLQVQVEIEAVTDRTMRVRGDTRGELPEATLKLDALELEPQEVVVEGPRSEVDAATTARAVLDLGRVTPGARTPYTVDVEVLDSRGRPLPNVRIAPPFVSVTPVLSAAPEERRLVVVPSFSGQPASGYLVTDFTLDPPQVLVRGRSMILAGTTTVETSPIDLAGLRQTRTFTATLRFPQGVDPVREQDRRVRVRVTIERAPTIGTVPRPTPLPPGPGPGTGPQPQPQPAPTPPPTTPPDDDGRGTGGG